MVECLCCFYSALSHDRRVFNKFKIRWFWLALLVSVYLNLLHRAMFGSNQHRSRYPFSYRFPNDITPVFSLVFSIIMCILSLWVSSLFEGNRELSCASGTREEAREPRIVSSPLACSLACYRAPRLACHSKWRALFYVSLNSINCIVVSSLLFSPSIYKYCFVICLQLPPPRLVYRLFAGGKVM